MRQDAHSVIGCVWSAPQRAVAHSDVAERPPESDPSVTPRNERRVQRHGTVGYRNVHSNERDVEAENNERQEQGGRRG